MKRWMICALGLLFGVIGVWGQEATPEATSLPLTEAFQPIYSNSNLRNFAWAADNTRLVFSGHQSGPIGVELSQPNWLQYDIRTATLSQSTTWQLQPTLNTAELSDFNPMQGSFPSFMFSSPNERFFAYVLSETYQLAVADRQMGQFFLIAIDDQNVNIPSPAFGPDAFRVMWSGDSSAFTVMYEPGYGEDFGTFYVTGFASEPANLALFYLGLEVGGRGFRNVTIHDISADGTQVLLTGIEVFPNTGVRDTETSLLLRDVINPENNTVFDYLRGTIQGASFAPNDEDKLLLVNEHGLVQYDRIRNEVTLLNDQISSNWVSHALFSPDGEYIALIHSTEPTTSVYVVSLADVVSQPVTPEATALPLTETYTSEDGQVSFQYPAGWKVEAHPVRFVDELFFASILSEALVRQPYGFETGAVQVLIGLREIELTSQELIEQLEDQLHGSELQRLTIQNGVMLMGDWGRTERAYIALETDYTFLIDLIVVTASAELDDWLSTAIAESIQLNQP